MISSVELRTGIYTDVFQRDAGGYRRTRGPLSPDGKTMYLARMNQARTAIADLVARDLAMGDERVLTTIEAGPSRDPSAAVALSPDGRTLAVAYWNVAFEDAHIFTIGVDGTNRRDVVASVKTGWIVDAFAWNPDGQSIVFLGFDAKKDWRLMRVNAAGGTPEPDGLDYDTLNPLLGDLRLFPGNFNTLQPQPRRHDDRREHAHHGEDRSLGPRRDVAPHSVGRGVPPAVDDAMTSRRGEDTAPYLARGVGRRVPTPPRAQSGRGRRPRPTFRTGITLAPSPCIAAVPALISS